MHKEETYPINIGELGSRLMQDVLEVFEEVRENPVG